MKDSFRIYKDFTILNSALEFTLHLVWTETQIELQKMR